MLVPALVLLRPNGSLHTRAKSARDLLQASFDGKMLGKHPKSSCLNESEVGHVRPEAPDENKQKQLRGEFATCGRQRGRNRVERLEIDLCWVPLLMSLERSNFIP
jgi:hypothetical protein